MGSHRTGEIPFLSERTRRLQPDRARGTARQREEDRATESAEGTFLPVRTSESGTSGVLPVRAILFEAHDPERQQALSDAIMR
jgi:hypothetical protein